MQGPWTARERVTSGEPGSPRRRRRARSLVGRGRRWRAGRGGWRARVVLLWIALLLAAMPAGAGPSSSDYDAQEAGHPLRIVAYVLHPLGVVLDTLIMRPAHWLGSHEPFKTLVGNTD